MIEAKRAHWNALVDDGIVEEWETTKSTDRDEMHAELGADRARLLARSSHLSAQIAKLAYEAFDELGTVPGAVETYPDERTDAAPFGWWAVLHTLTVQLNYSLEEELDVYRYGIEHALRNVAEFEGEAAADANLNDVIDALESVREDVKTGRLDS